MLINFVKLDLSLISLERSSTSRQSDTLIRTNKTIIHTLVRLQGDAILSNLGTIDNLKELELKPYLQKLFKSGVSKEKDATYKLPTSGQQSSRAMKGEVSQLHKKISFWLRHGFSELLSFPSSYFWEQLRR
jgi:hypothetical protein